MNIGRLLHTFAQPPRFADWEHTKTSFAERTTEKEEAVASSFSVILSHKEFYSTPPAPRRIVRSVDLSTEASPVDETSSPPVRSIISFARFTSSEVEQCTERRIPPF